jgi:uncharacterized membrane protein
LAVYGLRRSDPAGLLTAAFGGALLYRAAPRSCRLDAWLGVHGAHKADTKRALGGPRGILVEASVAIDRTPRDLYRFWRDIGNLPRFMSHLDSVEVLDDKRSRWTAKGPAGTSVHWVAEIVNAQEGRVIAWRSLPGSDVASAGSVWFRPHRQGRSTVVHVRLQYNPPAGKLGSAVARLLGEAPQVQIKDDLQRLKRLLEESEEGVRKAQPDSNRTPFARLRSPFVPPGDLNSAW